MTSLGKAVDDYLGMRRGLGYELVLHEIVLTEFVSFMASRRAAFVTCKLAVEFATLPQSIEPRGWARRLSAVRGFAAYYNAFDPRTETIPSRILPFGKNRKTPFLYTQEEVEQVLAAAERLTSTRVGVGARLRPMTYSTIYGLLTVTGLRIGELVALNREDIDWDNDLAKIRPSKHGSARLVPLHPTTMAKLEEYADLREQVFQVPTTRAFFVSRHGARVTYDSAQRTHVLLTRQLGMRGRSERTSWRRGPRLHDYRHRFAVETVLGWYRKGADVERLLPVLSTFLGHRKVSHTYWYLTAVPELLELATARVDADDGPSGAET